MLPVQQAVLSALLRKRSRLLLRLLQLRLSLSVTAALQKPPLRPLRQAILLTPTSLLLLSPLQRELLREALPRTLSAQLLPALHSLLPTEAELLRKRSTLSSRKLFRLL